MIRHGTVEYPPVDLIYIGNDFYADSGTIMSSIYEITEDGWRRSDWGDVQIALSVGREIHIRPATDAELGIAHKMLRDIKLLRRK